MSSEVETDPRIGTVLNGRYRITESLGEGGMGVVYRAERVRLDRPVAVKFLHSPYAGSKEFVTRFEREARAMSMLSHPCCVSVIDFGLDGVPYIVMDFVTGETLRSLLDQGRFAPQRAVAVIRQVLSGLAHAHGQGIIHRDVKPANIMLGEATGLGEHVRIFDFGLAKLQDPAAHGDPSVGHLIGTPAYMAPEQTRGDRFDARVDLYATGVVLFELLTGRKPFDAKETAQLLRQQRDQPPPHVRELVPEISEEMDAVVWKALEKEPDNRFATAEDFLTALDGTPEGQGRVSKNGARPTGEDIAYANTEAFASERVDSSRPNLPAGLQSTQNKPGSSGLSWFFWGTTLLLIAGVAAAWLLSMEGADRAAAESAARAAAESAAQAAAKGVARAANAMRTAGGEPSAIPVNQDPPPPRVTAVAPDAQATAPAPEPIEPAPEPIEPAPEPIEPATAPSGADEAVMRFKLSDAGIVGDDLSEVSLAEADQALNDTAESEAVVPALEAAPTARSMSEIKRLISRGRTAEAIDAIRTLRRKDGNDPNLPVLLGNLYFEKGWWSDGLVKYREAIRMRSSVASRATVQKNAIMALGGDKTYAKARALLVRDIRRHGLERLRRAAKSDPSPVVRKRAAAVVRSILR